MKKAKVISILVLVCFVFPILCTGNVLGSTINSSEFYSWLNDSGIPEYSVSGAYRANYSTFARYNLVVYGNAGNVPGNEIRQGEYRYLGFTYMEGKYTNLDFPNDETGNLPPEQWDYVTVSGAAESWDSLEQTVQRPYMLNTPLKGHGATNLTAVDIGTSKAKVQSAASWNSSGSIYTYKSNGFYATFTIPSMGPGILAAAISPKDNVVYVNEEDDEFKTRLNLIASVNKPAKEIKYIKAVFSCGDWRKVRYYYDTNSVDIWLDADFDVPGNLPGSVSIQVQVTAESIFGDTLERNVSCSVIVRESVGNGTPEPSPYPNPTYTPAPVPTPSPTALPSGEGENPGDGSGGQGNEKQVRIISMDISGSWEHWENQPHRFIALEKITVTAVVEGPAEKGLIRLSPQLEAMTYTNSLGHTYDYSDDFFGYTVKFPQDSQLYPETVSGGLTVFIWEYSIPLCDETINWNGYRLAEPYKIGFRVFDHSGHHETLIIEDIDITGNIYELLYPQPAD